MLKPCSDERQNGFKGLKLKRCKFLQPFFTPCEHDCFCLKVSEYPFKENKNSLNIMQVLLYTHFYNISLNVTRPNFLNICNLPISHFPNIRKIRVKVGPKTNYFSYFMSSCMVKILVFNIFFLLIFSLPREKQNRDRNFLLFK